MNGQIYDFQVQRNDGSEQSLNDYKGQVLLIVNTASRCGFTRQYDGLQKLYSEHKEKGFSVLGFPSNQFGLQEPGTNQEIAEFCTLNFGVTFPLYAKADVNGPNATPLYKYLKQQALDEEGNEEIQWNFTKFLVDKNGKIVKRYLSNVTPEAIESDILALLE